MNFGYSSIVNLFYNLLLYLLSFLYCFCISFINFILIILKGTAEFKISGRTIMCSIYDQQHINCGSWAKGETYEEEFEV